MASVRPAVPLSVPAIAAGGENGISDVTATQVADSAEIDKARDARLGAPGAAANAAGTAPGEGEQKAGLGVSAAKPGDPANAALAPSAQASANVNLPTNHPATKEQIKLYNKQVKKAQEAQKKAAAKAAASGQPAPGTTPAATDTTTPAAKPQ
jgi:hypothetical protein